MKFRTINVKYLKNINQELRSKITNKIEVKVTMINNNLIMTDPMCTVPLS